MEPSNLPNHPGDSPASGNFFLITTFEEFAKSCGVTAETPIKVNFQAHTPEIKPPVSAALFQDIKQSSTAAQLNSNAEKLLNKLSNTSCFSRIEAKINPGDEVDTANVTLELKHAPSLFGYIALDSSRSHRMFISPRFGFLNTFGYLENFSYNLKRDFGFKDHRSHNFMAYFPVVAKDISAELLYTISNERITNSIREHARGGKLRFAHEKYGAKVGLNAIFRKNSFDLLNIAPETLKTEIVPSSKYSIEVSKKLKDTIADVEQGESCEVKGEIAVCPHENQFLKFELHHHKYFTPKAFDKVTLLSGATFENLLNFGIVVPFGKRNLRINDRFRGQGLRGFEDIGNKEWKFDTRLHPSSGSRGFEYLADHFGSDILLTNTGKINLRPIILLGLGFIPYFNVTAAYYPGIVFGRKLMEPATVAQPTKPSSNLRGSIGAGFSFILAGKKIDLSYSFFHYARDSDKIARFQLRLADYD